LGFVRWYPPKYRADLDQKPAAGESREQALARVYYNVLLLRKWHFGGLPHKGYDELKLRRQAAALTRRSENR
jgi:hypothetical protein